MENENWVTENVRLSIGGEPLDWQMCVTAKTSNRRECCGFFTNLTKGKIPKEMELKIEK